MRVLVAGAGPAGLYFPYLSGAGGPLADPRRRAEPRRTRPSASAWCSPTGRSEFLREDDPSTYDLITPQMEAWTDLTVVHRGTPVVIDGIGFAAIGRLKLLRLLQQQAASVGIVPEYENR